MTAILSDAEYRRLTDNEKAKYWCDRYYEAAAEIEELHRKVLIRDQVIRVIRETLTSLQ